MTKAACCLAFALALFASGCGRDNGLPKELLAHLADRGLQVTASRSYAPLSSRGGYIVTKCSAEMVSNIIGTFKLEKIAQQDRQWQRASAQAGGVASSKELWGLTGRPAQFKLKSGGQFEYFYLLVTKDGWVFLIAEYAYG